MSEPNILIFDVETTGTDKQRDQVIELCAQFGLGDGAKSKTFRIRPHVAIHPGAQKVHGISMEDLRNAPTFAEVADELRGLFANAQMLVGYNIRFDIDMVQAEFQRLQQAPLDLSKTYVVDPFRLWQRCEPRSLMDAHKRFVGGEFSAAHSAQADVSATGRVLLGMVEAFDLGTDWEAVADICEPERKSWIGGTHHVQRGEGGVAKIGFGKHYGISLSELAAGPDRSYLEWLVESDFPNHVRDIGEHALRLDDAAFASWLANAYPSASTEEAKPEDAASKAPEPPMGQQNLF